MVVVQVERLRSVVGNSAHCRIPPMWSQIKGPKYHNTPQTYNGYNYQSKKEANRAAELDMLLKAGEIKGWERQYKLELMMNGYRLCNYYMDFRVLNNDGTETWEEVKGFETPLWKLKWKITEAQYGDDPKIKLVVIK